MYELEEKFLLDNSFHESKIKIPDMVLEHINQIYCGDYRIREVTSDNNIKYWFNKKIKSNIVAGANIEIETEITKDIFDDLYLNKKTELFKYRYKFSYGDFLYDLDQFYYKDVLGNENFYLKVLEIEYPTSEIPSNTIYPDCLMEFILGRFENPSNHKISEMDPKDVFSTVKSNLI